MYSTNRIFILFLCFGDDHLISGFRKIFDISRRMFTSAEINAVVIQNNVNTKLDLGFIQGFDLSSIEYIYGDNSCHEFSGWDVGFNFLKNKFKLEEKDLIVFANDTFHRRMYTDGGSDYLNFFNAQLLHKINSNKFAIGYLDDFPNTVSLLDISYKCWIRSNIFMLSYLVAEQVHPLKFPLNRNLIFNENGSFFKNNSLVSENWRAYISSWLFGESSKFSPEYNLTWIKSQKLSDLNRVFFQTKALTILSEHYLSARLHELKIDIIDTNTYPKRADRHITPYYK